MCSSIHKHTIKNPMLSTLDRLGVSNSKNVQVYTHIDNFQCGSLCMYQYYTQPHSNTPKPFCKCCTQTLKTYTSQTEYICCAHQYFMRIKKFKHTYKEVENAIKSTAQRIHKWSTESLHRKGKSPSFLELEASHKQKHLHTVSPLLLIRKSMKNLTSGIF